MILSPEEYAALQPAQQQIICDLLDEEREMLIASANELIGRIRGLTDELETLRAERDRLLDLKVVIYYEQQQQHQ